MASTIFIKMEHEESYQLTIRYGGTFTRADEKKVVWSPKLISDLVASLQQNRDTFTYDVLGSLIACTYNAEVSQIDPYSPFIEVIAKFTASSDRENNSFECMFQDVKQSLINDLASRCTSVEFGKTVWQDYDGNISHECPASEDEWTEMQLYEMSVNLVSFKLEKMVKTSQCYPDNVDSIDS